MKIDLSEISPGFGFDVPDETPEHEIIGMIRAHQGQMDEDSLQKVVAMGSGIASVAASFSSMFNSLAGGKDDLIATQESMTKALGELREILDKEDQTPSVVAELRSLKKALPKTPAPVDLSPVVNAVGAQSFSKIEDTLASIEKLLGKLIAKDPKAPVVNVEAETKPIIRGFEVSERDRQGQAVKIDLLY